MATTLTHLDFPSTDPTHFVHIISNLLSPEECAEIIKSHTNLEPSNLTLGTIRTREQFDDEALVALLWSRMGQFYIGNRIKDKDGFWWKAKGLNPHFRLSKYEKRGKFTAHFDYRRLISINEQTFMSVNIYLNTVPEKNKGATRVLKHFPSHGNYWNGRDVLTALAKVQPVQGSASVFRETLWHDGEELLDGVKYLLRTDVVYEREEAFDFEKLYGGESRQMKADKALEIGYMLDDGGNPEEAEVWHSKAFKLDPGNYFGGGENS